MTLRIAVRWTSINSYTLPLPLPFSVSVLLATRRHSEVQKRAQNFNKHPSCCCERADRTELSEIAVYNVLTMAISSVAVWLFTVCFNVFVRWHQRLWFKSVEFERIGWV